MTKWWSNMAPESKILTVSGGLGAALVFTLAQCFVDSVWDTNIYGQSLSGQALEQERAAYAQLIGQDDPRPFYHAPFGQATDISKISGYSYRSHTYIEHDEPGRPKAEDHCLYTNYNFHALGVPLARREDLICDHKENGQAGVAAPAERECHSMFRDYFMGIPLAGTSGNGTCTPRQLALLGPRVGEVMSAGTALKMK